MKWFSERMTEVEIEVPDRYVSKVTELLANEGFLQLENISYLSIRTESSPRTDWQAKANQFANLEKQLADTMKSLDIDAVKPLEQRIKMVSDPTALKPFADQLAEEIYESSSTLIEAQEKILQLQHNNNLLEPLSDVDVPLDRIRNRRYIYSILGVMPAGKIERFKTSMAKIPFALLVLKQMGDDAIVLLFGLRQNKEYLRRAARSAYLSGIDLSDSYQGTPAQIIDTLRQEIESLQKQIVTNSQEVAKIRENRAERVRNLYWRVRYSRLMSEAIMNYGRLEKGYLVAGWLPSARLDEMVNNLQKISTEILVEVKEDPTDKEAHSVPVLIDETGFQSGFQKLVLTYGLPTYNELNPTALMMFTFPLIFGAMFGDVGHGLVLVIAGMFFMTIKNKKLKRFSSLGSVILMCGLAAMVFGFLYGAVFGMEDVIPSVWQHPMNNIMSLLLITAAGGVLLLTLANLLSIINDIHQHKWIHLFFDRKGLAGLLLYWSLIGIILNQVVKDFPINQTIFVITAIISVIMMFFFGYLEKLVEKKKPYLEGGLFVYSIQSFFELFETVIGYLSNTLSYVRIGAFAVAHAGLSSVFFILAEIVSPTKGFGYWLVVVIGNIFVIGFEGLIVSIQTLRLEYYEFFSKFFSGNGRKYTPFRLGKSNSKGVI